MNIRCPNCQTAFRVNPARIPPAGVRARCARCGATFAVKPPDGPAAGSGAPAAAATPGGAPAATGTPGGAPAAAPAGSAAPSGAPAPAVAGARAGGTGAEQTDAAPAGAGAGAGTAAPSAGGAAQAGVASARAAESATRTSPFGSRDPNARAQRIARALVSDIVAYHPQRRDECLAAGTLRTEFREEIMKSWEEYVAQVGLDMARSTPFFRNALNDILAKGQQLF